MYYLTDHPVAKPIGVNRKGVLKLPKDIDPYKATGPDNIPGRLLKTLCDEMVDTLCTILQASLDQGIIPKAWKKAYASLYSKKEIGSKLPSTGLEVMKLVHSQTQNKAQRLVACGYESASSQSLRFILSLRLYSSCIASRPVLYHSPQSVASYWNILYTAM